MKRPSTSVLARSLHELRCRSFAGGYCSGEDHVRRSYVPLMRECLADGEEHFWERLHANVCDATLDPNHTCPDPKGHTERVRIVLSGRGVAR